MTDVQNKGVAKHVNDRPWRAEVLARVAVLEASAESVCPTNGGPARNERLCAKIRQLLDDAKEQATAKRKLLDRPKDFRNGGPIERAWRSLHSAEVLLAEVVAMSELSSQRPAVRSMAKRVLPADDVRTQAIDQSLSDATWAELPKRREAARSAKMRNDYVASLTWVHDACDKNFTRVRSFRNLVLAASVGLAVVAIGLGVLGAVNPESLPLCFDPSARSVENVVGTPSSNGPIVCPTGVHTAPTGGDVPLVLVVGLAAGAFAAALAVRNMRGTSTPYCVPVAIAWLKLPAGALTALFAMLMLRGGFIPGLSALDNQAQIIAYSIVFGYAQQIFTRLVDNQAQAVLDRSPSTEPGGAPAAAGTADAAASGGLATDASS